jgi:hypothetical protein
VHASWMSGVVVLGGVLTVGLGLGDLPGLLFLGVYFLPVFIAFRRDRLTFPIVFSTIFLPTWPLAAYMALRRTPPASTAPSAT